MSKSLSPDQVLRNMPSLWKGKAVGRWLSIDGEELRRQALQKSQAQATNQSCQRGHYIHLPMPKDSSLPLTEIARQGCTKLQYVQKSHGKHVSAMDCALILSGRPVFFFHLADRHEIFSLLSMYSLNSLIFLFPVLAVKKYCFGLNHVGGL